MNQNMQSSSTMVRHSAPSVRSAYRSLGMGWHFRLLHFAAVALTLPIFTMARMWPGHRHKDQAGSIFAEANNAALIAFGFALMS